MFEQPSRLATIEHGTFFSCESLKRLCIPASVTAIHGLVFNTSGISSIEIEEESVSFRILNGFLVDFEVRSLLYVIGSPESILITSSIEELRPFCCWGEQRLSKVEFEPCSNLRSIGESAFSCCESLKSISIPSSVEFLRKSCFEFCRNLRTITFGPESKLRVIEKNAVGRSVKLVSVPASAEVIRR
jgi:hypothetical protein